MPKKQALKGLSGIKVFEVLEDTESTYRVGEGIRIPYAQKMTKDIQSSSDDIYADDEIYDDEEIFEGENFELTVPEAKLESMPIIEGGEYDEGTGEYSWGPECENRNKYYAMTFKAKRKDGKYRMFRYYKAKFKKVKQDLATDEKGKQISVLVISGTFYKRALLSDPKVRANKDSDRIEDLAWLDTVPTVPTQVQGEVIPEDGE